MNEQHFSNELLATIIAAALTFGGMFTGGLGKDGEPFSLDFTTLVIPSLLVVMAIQLQRIYSQVRSHRKDFKRLKKELNV